MYIDYIERVWNGAASVSEPPVVDGLVALGDRTGWFPRFANVTVLDTGDGLVLVDSGEFSTAAALHTAVRAWSDAPVTDVIFTHGHLDHVFGVFPFDIELGTPRPRVIAHEAVQARFDRYAATAGYNSGINRQQFQRADARWPRRFRRPDQTYRDRFIFTRGDLTFELRHARGETDDATYVWIPQLSTICAGDLFIWNAPNAGNPQKVQRYPLEWAHALREMHTLDASVLLPGHGVPILGKARIAQALDDTATLLESLCTQTLDLMNAGARLDEVIHTVRAPEELLAKPYLVPFYDEPEFIVHNIWRLYGGWYDQNPAHLKPAPDAALAAEIAALAGGPDALARRAVELIESGQDRLAGHLAEWAAQSAPDDTSVAEIRARVFAARAALERSTMSKGIFTWAAVESHAKATGRDPLQVLAENAGGDRGSIGTALLKSRKPAEETR